MEKLKEQILAQFPVGSEWYDREQDDIVTIAHHLLWRGILATSRVPLKCDDLTGVGYTDLLNGRLTPVGPVPSGKNTFDTWREEQKLATEASAVIIGRRTLWT